MTSNLYYNKKITSIFLGLIVFYLESKFLLQKKPTPGIRPKDQAVVENIHYLSEFMYM